MATEKEEKLYQDRLKKLEKLKAAGVDPYPAKGERTQTVAEALTDFAKLSKGKKKIALTGRIKALRAHGGLIFGNIEDESGSMQFMLRQEDLGKEKFAAFDSFDIGDIFEAHGMLLETKAGEKTILLSDFRILTKSLRALPDQYHGLKDVETRLRKRYLDLLANPDVREMFRKKSVFWKTVRDFMIEKGFLEVEMPVLESVPGGAEAEPFVTHHNALDRDFYLRISLELPLKRLLVGGYEKVFEIGRIFRNEGISTEHLQDYTQMEFYWAYADYHDMMEMLVELYQRIIKNLLGTTRVKSQGVEIDWGKPWKKYDYYELFKKNVGLDLHKATVNDLKTAADKLKIKYEKFADKGRLIDLIYKKSVRPTLIESGFLIDPPVEVEPLAKRSSSDPSRVERLQIMAWGTELGKGFSELNDPIDQRERFETQMKLRAAGDKEAQQLDEDFVEALEYGMPPAAGFGMSERFFAVLMDKSIRETVIFPPMKEEASLEGKAKETKMAVAVINSAAELEPWQEMNTMAHLNAAFAARVGRQLLYQDEIITSDDEKIKLNIQHAIMIKTAPSSEAIAQLADSAKEAGLEVSEFIREMIETTDDRKVIDLTKKKKRKDVEYLGVLVFGKKSVVEALTKDLPLYESRGENNPKPAVSSARANGKVPSRDEALKLLYKHVKTPNLLKHMLATEALMRGLARKFGEDEDKWGIAGLLHDIDYDETKDPKMHSLKGYEILMNAAIDTEICEAVKIHNPEHGIPPATLLDKALLTGETMTGFLVACALVTPEKKLASVNLDSAMKKFASKSFAAGADREIMKQVELLLGMKLEELMEICLREMQKISGELGL